MTLYSTQLRQKFPPQRVYWVHYSLVTTAAVLSASYSTPLSLSTGPHPAGHSEAIIRPSEGASGGGVGC